VRLSTAGVMKTLMRNGRDRRSENPLLGHAKKERVVLIGTDQRITSGPAAKRPQSKAEYMTAPERFADNSQIPLALRAPSIHDPTRTWAAYFCSDVPCQARTPRLGVLPPQSVLEAIEVMIVQRWGRSLETSVIML